MSSTPAELHWVASADEGLEFLRRQGCFADARPVHLVVTDLSMPGMSGFEFLAEVRQNPEWAAIPVVIFSSSRAPREVRRCYQMGANSYIAKPMSLETLVAAVETLTRYWLDIVELPDPRSID